MKRYKKPVIRSKVKIIKEQIKSGTYNWQKGIEGAASKIANNPEVLLWR